ncbi:hypothetical protein B0H17DRAFT_1137794 [Mycena rosella]|uniref:Uncharacterized protein n=1 Tax=Mycena rosella TaxID=1033263 RepID=A0AAD7GF26_MYCRO|nr:hypothetical protein B0H17DRAFT_1137794 [Mycena rosella]
MHAEGNGWMLTECGRYSSRCWVHEREAAPDTPRGTHIPFAIAALTMQWWRLLSSSERTAITEETPTSRISVARKVYIARKGGGKWRRTVELRGPAGPAASSAGLASARGQQQRAEGREAKVGVGAAAVRAGQEVADRGIGHTDHHTASVQRWRKTSGVVVGGGGGSGDVTTHEQDNESSTLYLDICQGPKILRRPHTMQSAQKSPVENELSAAASIGVKDGQAN